MAAAAADTPIAEQGYPANLLQPTGTGPDLAGGQGPVGDGGRRLRRARVVRRAAAARSRSPPTAPTTRARRPAGRPGSSAPSRPGPTSSRPARSGCRRARRATCRTTFAGDPRYAYVQGTSMATPMVAATGALIRHLNPDLTAAEIVRADQGDRAPARRARWTGDLGWGILDAGAALTRAASIDRRAPSSRVRRLPARTASATITRALVGGRHGSGRACAPRASRASSCGARPTAGRFKRLFSTTRTSRQRDSAPRRPLPLLHRRDRPRRQPRAGAQAGRRADRSAAARRSAGSRSAPRRCSRARASSSASDASMPSAMASMSGSAS